MKKAFSKMKKRKNASLKEKPEEHVDGLSAASMIARVAKR